MEDYEVIRSKRLEVIQKIEEFEKQPFWPIEFKIDLKQLGPPSRIGRIDPTFQPDSWLIKLKTQPEIEFVLVLVHVKRIHEAAYFVGCSPDHTTRVYDFLYALRKINLEGLQYEAGKFASLGYVPD